MTVLRHATSYGASSTRACGGIAVALKGGEMLSSLFLLLKKKAANAYLSVIVAT